MKKLSIIPFLMIYLLSACANYAIQRDTTETPFSTTTQTTTQTPIPPTATATPLPVPISANNFSQIEQVSTSVLDQSKFVGFNLSKIGFLSVEANVPDGDFKEAYFLSYQRLDNGDIVGLLNQLPLNCGLKTFGQDKRNCSIDRYYYSMINLSQGSILWTQFIPINMAGKELNDLIAELGIENFKPGFGSSSVNGGFWVNKWSNDNLQITIPVQIVNTTLVKDTLSGKNILMHPWGGSPCWIGVVSPDKTKFAFISGGPQGKKDILRIMNIADQTIDVQFEVSNSATDMVWSGDNSKIAVGKFDGSVDVFYLDTKETKNLIRERYLPDRKQGQGITRLKFSEDGLKIALTENNYTSTDEKISRLAIYDLETKKEVNSYAADFYQTGNLIWSHDGSFVVTVTDFTGGRLVLMNETTAIEYSLTFPDNIAEYYPREFTSLIYFNEDQTQLTLIRSLFNDAVVTEYKVKK